MKAGVIREMSSTEIEERIETEKSAYHKMKMNHVVSNLENPLKLKFARKAIARLSTELTKRENEENSTTKVAKTPAKTAKAKVEVEVEVETVEVEKTDENEKA